MNISDLTEQQLAAIRTAFKYGKVTTQKTYGQPKPTIRALVKKKIMVKTMAVMPTYELTALGNEVALWIETLPKKKE